MEQLVNDKHINRSHYPRYSELTTALNSYKNKCSFDRDGLKEQKLALIGELANFDLGKHILLTGGANGLWTDYMINPFEYHCDSDFSQNSFSLVESFLLFHSPVVLAQRELFNLSKKVAQRIVSDGKVLASLPCGVMRDLLSLDFSSNPQVSLIGIDIDLLSLEHSRKLAKKLQVSNTTFIRQDAWQLEFEEEFDFISSIGLNVYEADKKKVTNLYIQLHKALKPGGTLFTGVLTWPPYIDQKKSEWNIKKISEFDFHMEKIIHNDILDIKWLNFRMLPEIKREFQEAGFSKVEIIQDSLCVFPAVIAIK